MAKGFAVALHPNAPESLLAVLVDYLHVVGPLRFFVASSIQHGTTFVDFGIVKRIEDKPWQVAIPSQYIVAIMEVGDQAPIGFRLE